jgi:hypothetical protein
MAGTTLTAALEREHREIDSGIETYLSGRELGALQQAMTGLRRHIYLEEAFLVPPLRAAGMFGPIMVMLREHGELWQTMDGLGAQLAEGTAAEESCRRLLELLARHNEKEEPIVYPQADEVLPEQDAADLHAFLESGEIPPGWVCQAAQRR